MKLTKRKIEQIMNSPEALDSMMHVAWSFAYSALWNHSIFSTIEKDKARRAIRQYLVQSDDREKAYYTFCQRVLLAREYISQDASRFIPLPSHWLDFSNVHGFTGTEQWMEKMQDKRSSMPLYRREWKALAEAVYEMATDASEKNFWYWKIYFLEREEGVLWDLFLSMIANMEFES